jgi:chemotaxis protein histidine kinase CheA
MSSDQFKLVLEQLSAEYRGSLPDKVAELDALWRAVLGGGAIRERLHELHRALHTIAGSAKVFGLSAVTEAARAGETALELCLTQGTMPEAAARAEVERVFEVLKQCAAAKP